MTVSIRAVKGPSFMEVRTGSASGSRSITGTLEKGQLQRFTKKALYLSVARPGNVVVRFNGGADHSCRAPVGLTVSGATAVSG